MSLKWVAIKTVPIHRIEFTVLHHITQREHPAMVPFEEKHVKKSGKHTEKRKFPYFPTYVFAGLRSFADYLDIRNAINNHEPSLLKYRRPLVQGIVSFGGRPATLTEDDVVFLSRLTREGARPTAVNLHKAFRVGGKVNIVDGPFRGMAGTVDSVTKHRIRVMLRLFARENVIDFDDASALEAA